MKRLLCSLLAIAMLISLLPAVSFAVDTRETQIYSFLKADNDNVADGTEITDTVGNKNLVYLSHKSGYGTTNDFSKWDGTNPSVRFSMYSWGDNATDKKAYNFAAYTIKGICKGEYKVALEYAVHSNGAEDVEVYILNGNTTDIKAAIENTSNEPVLSDINMLADSKGSSTTYGTFTAKNDGDHILVFIRRNETGKQCVTPKTLTLTPVKTAEYKDVTHSLYATELVGKGIDFTAQINTPDGIFVPEKTGDGLAVTTDNDDVAEIIDATYKDGIYSAKLKTKATGGVNINFTATVDGKEYPSSFKLEVIEIPKPYEISVSFDKDAWSGLSNPSGITYANSSRTIEWIGTSSTNGTQNGWSGDHSFFNLGTGKYAAYQMYLPAEGEYTLTLDYVQNDSNGAVADVYLIPGLKNDITAATAAASPVFENINCRNEMFPGTASTDTRFDITEGGAYTLVFMSRDHSGGYAVRIDGLTLTPYIPPEYGKTEISLHDTEVTGRDIPFTVMAVMSDGKNFVPELTGDGIDVSLQSTDKAEIVDAT
ncbi:MAG: hypothetical protein IJP38_01995, partial [Oscillospiraceae bacterium]|nr:hypothetical protein [Oscillospiraceae bacterium]